MIEFSLFAVFMVGLLGGVHCLGMCGSIVGILTSQLPAGVSHAPYHVAYSAGRLFSYSLAGVLVGLLGQAGMVWRDQVPVQLLLFALSSLMLILLGLYLAGVWGMVRQLERLGGKVWKVIQPLTRYFLPVNSYWRAAGLGMLWGWLPCGLVYSVLVTALATGSAGQGGLVMLVFGLGTLPNLLLIGLFWSRIKAWVQALWLRLLAGGVIASMGLFGLTKVAYTFYLHGWSGSCHVAI